MSFIEKYRVATRKDIDGLLLGKFSDVLNEEHKQSRLFAYLTQDSR